MARIQFGEEQQISKGIVWGDASGSTGSIETSRDMGVPGYEDILATSKSARNWYEFMVQMSEKPIPGARAVFELMFETAYPKLVEKNSSGLLRGLGRSTRLLAGAEFDMDHSTARNFGLSIAAPVFTFSKKNYFELLKRVDRTQLMQGIALRVRMAHDTNPVGAVFVCRDRLEGQMEPEQIKRHESVHVLDSLMSERCGPDREILDKLIAVLGEVTDDPSNMLPVHVDPGWWEAYLRKIPQFSPEFFRVFRLSTGTSDLGQISRSMSAYVKEISKARSHKDIVMLLMSCRDFGDVWQKLNHVYPDMYAQE